MFTSAADLSAMAADHQRELLADADGFRLARVARAARRRAAHRVDVVPGDPVRTGRDDDAGGRR